MRLLILLLLWMSVTACVTETRIAGSNKVVVPQDINKESAAKNRVALGLRYLRNGDTEQAKSNLEQARAFSPEMGEVHYALAYYYQTVGEVELAEVSYKDALRYEPHDGATMNNYAIFLCQQKRYDEADAYFIKATQEPSYIRVADAYENAGYCALSAKLPSKAKIYINKALSYNANRPGSLIAMSEASLQLHQLETAEFYLSRYLSSYTLDAGSAVLGYRLALAQGSSSNQQHYLSVLKTKFPQAYQALLEEKTP